MWLQIRVKITVTVLCATLYTSQWQPVLWVFREIQDNLNWSLMLILKWKCAETEGWKTTTLFYFRDLRFSLPHPHPTLWFLLSRRLLSWIVRRKCYHSSTTGQIGLAIVKCSCRVVSWEVSTQSPAVRWRWQTACMLPPSSVLCSAWWWMVTLLTQHQDPSWAAGVE